MFRASWLSDRNRALRRLLSNGFARNCGHGPRNCSPAADCGRTVFFTSTTCAESGKITFPEKAIGDGHSGTCLCFKAGWMHREAKPHLLLQSLLCQTDPAPQCL